MEDIMDLDLIGFDENGDEDENSTRNVIVLLILMQFLLE